MNPRLKNLKNLINFELKSVTILIVDDDFTNLAIITQYLQNAGFRVLIARNGQAGLTRAQHVKPDIILMDVMMPDINGFEVCRRLKEIETTQHIPVIFMTALTRVEDKIKGFDAGGVDYVTKPLQQEEVIVRVITHLRVKSLVDRLAEQNEQLQRYQQHLLLSEMVWETVVNASKTTLTEQLATVAQHIQSQLACTFVGVWQVLAATDSLVLKAVAYKEAQSSLAAGLELQKDKGNDIVLEVLRTETYHVANATETQFPTPPQIISLDTQTALPQTQTTLADSQSRLTLPILAKEGAIGVLDLQDDTPCTFTLDDGLPLQLLAKYLVFAIQKFE